MKVVFIDVEKHEVTLKQVSGRLDDYYEAIGCRCLALVEFDEDHQMMLDDESLLKSEYIKGFELREPEEAAFNIFPQDYHHVGNAVIASNGEYGEAQSVEEGFLDIVKERLVGFWESKNKYFV